MELLRKAEIAAAADTEEAPLDADGGRADASLTR
jgi:hypothetical protein